MIKPFSLKKRSGVGTPFIMAIVLSLLLLFSAISEISRLWIISHGVQEAAQDAILSAVNDNYDDIYHAAREGYAAGWFPSGSGWQESRDFGNVYGHLSKTLGLVNQNGRYVKYAGNQVEFSISSLSVSVRNNGLRSGQSKGYTAVATVYLEIPIRFLGGRLPPAKMKIHAEATYMPLF